MVMFILSAVKFYMKFLKALILVHSFFSYILMTYHTISTAVLFVDNTSTITAKLDVSHLA
jgi:hypothetical protein